MGGAGLQCFAVLHEGLDTVGVEGAAETFVRRFHTHDDGDSHVFLRKIGINMDHFVGFFQSFLACGVSGVTLLPQELSSTEEEAGAHLPTNHISPLVAEDGQVAVRLNPIFVGIPNDGLGSRAHDELLLQFCIGIDDDTAAVRIVFQSIVGNHGTLFSETFHVTGLAAEEGFRDKNREIGIGMACIFKHLVQLTLHFLPNGIAVRLNHHTSAHGRIFRQIRFFHNVVIPLRIVLFS